MKQSRLLLGAVAALAVAAAVLVPTAGADNGRSTYLAAGLKGANEVPPASVGDPDGAGYALIRVSRPAQRQVCVEDIAFGGIGTPVAYHIHQGRAGTNGPVVIDFTSLLPSGLGCVSVPDIKLMVNVARNPDRFYVNVHTAEFPGGAIRGNLVTVVP
jgi:hypothetical protein